MIYTRGNENDFDRLRDCGVSGWSWKDVLPYYLKSEKQNGLIDIEPKYHSTHGLLGITNPYYPELVNDFIAAGEEMGYPETDYNNGKSYGFARVQSTTYNGLRSDAATAYLNKAESRSNLHIQTNSYVTRLLIAQDKSVYGVEYVKNGQICYAYATKEVILTAGSRNSPKILMLSGIGPKDHLESLGIKVIVNSPVGKFFEDHVAFMAFPVLINDSENSLNALDFGDPMIYYDFNTNRTGPLTSIGSVQGLAFIKTNRSKEVGNLPDIEIISTFGHLSTDRGVAFASSWGVGKDNYEKFFQPIELMNVIGFFPILLQPKSHGYMKLRSSNPFDAPIFYGNYFTDKYGEDKNTMLEAIRFILQLLETDAFRKYNATLSPIKVPGCEDKPEFEDYWGCALETLSTSLVHQVGTCKMGRNKKWGVVNSRGLVYGVKNLRIADLSILPKVPRAHTYAVVIMIAEKICDFIKEHWNAP